MMILLELLKKKHKNAAQFLWNKLKSNNQIYLSNYEGWYSIRDEAFYQESELTKTENGFVAPSGATVEWVKEESYFFKLSKWENRLIEFYEKNKDAILPKSRYNEVMSFIKGGLKDLSISRTTFKWGISVPEADDHVMYVWIDALCNYITALNYPDINNDSFKKFWPGIHIVGKDILRFHAVYWPAFLMAADLEPPKKIFAHGWWTNEGQKISKSLGNVINPYEIIDQYGLDQIRFFLFREVPFGNDGDFSKDAIAQRVNADLSNNYGNLIQRIASFIIKNVNAKVSKPKKN
jgi:methionyl-tRNA synthetase